MLIVIVGMPCSGKTTALEVCKKLGARTVASGDIVRDEIRRRGLPYNKITDRDVSGMFHEKGGERLLIERVLERVGGVRKARLSAMSKPAGFAHDPAKDFIAIDGLRDVEQLQELERRTKVKPMVIRLDASFDVRLRRCIGRHRFTDESRAYLKSRDDVEKRRGLGEMMKRADLVFDTEDFNEAQFRKAFESFLKTLLAKRTGHKNRRLL